MPSPFPPLPPLLPPCHLLTPCCCFQTTSPALSNTTVALSSNSHCPPPSPRPSRSNLPLISNQVSHHQHTSNSVNQVLRGFSLPSCTMLSCPELILQPRYLQLLPPPPSLSNVKDRMAVRLVHYRDPHSTLADPLSMLAVLLLPPSRTRP